MSRSPRLTVVRPTLEVISSTDGTSRAELIALPAVAATDRGLRRVVSGSLRASCASARRREPADAGVPPQTAA